MLCYLFTFGILLGDGRDACSTARCCMPACAEACPGGQNPADTARPNRIRLPIGSYNLDKIKDKTD